jgi:hypothetical protein
MRILFLGHIVGILLRVIIDIILYGAKLALLRFLNMVLGCLLPENVP